MQGKHNKSRSLKVKILSPLLALALLSTGVIPAVRSGLASATAAKVDESVGLAANEYNAPVNSNNSENEGLYWAEATYFDYLTDTELSSSNGWLNPLQAGTGFNGSVDEWYPFFDFNRNVVKARADLYSNWSKPLYFGNFCNTSGSYDTSNHHVGDTYGRNGYENATHSDNVTRFDYAANNSNGLSNRFQSYQGLMQEQLDTSGNLMATSGSNALKAPYFDKEYLTSSDKQKYAKIVNSKFPFTVEKRTLANGMEYSYYEFNSLDAEDNVYFNWSNGKPTGVNYGAGMKYGVQDGMKYFMNPAQMNEDNHIANASGYGIFPFNNRDGVNNTGTRYIYLNKDNVGWGNAYCRFYDNKDNVISNVQMQTYGDGSNLKATIPTGAARAVFHNGNGDQTIKLATITHGAYWLGNDKSVHNWDVVNVNLKAGTGNAADNENLDYGFGIKMNMKFRVPKYGTIDGTQNGDPVKFEYSGDDDLWVYITDVTAKKNDPSGNYSHLVLDLGGNHKMAKGEINFKTGSMYANAVDVYGKGQNQKKYFNSWFDYTHDYEMTIFYMERGMLESNCFMSFTMVPLGNEVTVTEKIDTTNINDGLKTKVAGLDSFTFTPTAGANGETAVSNLNYMSNGTPAQTNGSTFDLGDNGKAYFSNAFTTNNKIRVKQTKSSSSYLIYDSDWTYSDKVGTQTQSHNYTSTLTGSGFQTDTKTLIDNRTNDTYDFASLQVDYKNAPKSTSFTLTKAVTGKESDTTEFGGTVLVKLKDGEDFQAYPLKYTASDLSGTYTLSSSGGLQSGAALKMGRTLTFDGIPVGAQIKVVEGENEVYEYYGITVADNNASLISVTPVDKGGWFTIGSNGNNVTVTNTPPTGLQLTKKVVDASGTEQTGDTTEFGANILVRYKNDTTFQARALEYTVSDKPGQTFHLSAGSGALQSGAALKEGRTISFNSIPKGAKFQITESSAAGYNYTSVTAIDATGAATVVNNLTNGNGGWLTVNGGETVTVTNTLQSGSGTIDVYKHLDGQNYSGNMFSFTMTGLDPGTSSFVKPGADGLGGTDDDVQQYESFKSAAGVTVTQNVVQQGGKVSFGVSFNSAGWYKYKIEEAPLNDTQTANGWFGDKTTFYVVFQVELNTSSNKLVITEKYYYVDEACNDYAGDATDVFFDNYSPAKIIINKADGNGNPVNETNFAVVKVDRDYTNNLPEDYVERLNEIIDDYDGTSTDTMLGETTTNGKLEFANLPIWQNGDLMFSFDFSDNWVYGSTFGVDGGYDNQTYMVFEYSPKNGYNSNQTVHFVTFPYGQDGLHEVTYDYVNAPVMMPDSSGSGMRTFLTLGIGILGSAAMMAMAYVLYNKRCQVRRRVGKPARGRHFK